MRVFRNTWLFDTNGNGRDVPGSLLYLAVIIVFVLLISVLSGCGPTVVVLHNPASGETAQCKGDPWANWNPYAATEACAKGYEAVGFKRVGSY